ncbi:MAG: cold shock domain-containing protein [Rhodanobacteraceae bacterium]|nr:cold shock domain-containing protein [Rhodanobacteraceae bacterium]
MGTEINTLLRRRLVLAVCLCLGIGLSDFAFANHKGTVVQWDAEKGGGVIRDTAGDLMYFHSSDLIDPVQVGDSVTFRAVSEKRGLRAQIIQNESSSPTPPDNANTSDEGSWQEADDNGFDEIDDSFDDDGE